MPQEKSGADHPVTISKKLTHEPEQPKKAEDKKDTQKETKDQEKDKEIIKKVEHTESKDVKEDIKDNLQGNLSVSKGNKKLEKGKSGLLKSLEDINEVEEESHDVGGAGSNSGNPSSMINSKIEHPSIAKQINQSDLQPHINDDSKTPKIVSNERT